jgi:hypothetical protein
VYSQRVTRSHPTLFVFLLDRSTSMEAAIAGRDQSKAAFVADALNSTVANTSLQCASQEGMRDYVHVVALGYGYDVSSVLPGSRVRQPISELANSPLRLDTRSVLTGDGTGGVVDREVQLPVWVEPEASGLTPMVSALEQAYTVVDEWVREFPNTFPPVVMNITDGGATDGDPRPVADRIRKLATSDGEALLFNVHVSDFGGEAVRYPVTPADLAGVEDELAHMLFDMSSEIPPLMVERAAAAGLAVRERARGMVYLAEASDVVRFLDFGTRTNTK